jgi:adenylate cyclase
VLTQYNAACVYAQLGEPDRAIDLLAAMPLVNSEVRAWLREDSDLDSLRSHPRFQALADGAH